jgi:hypothetical protein
MREELISMFIDDELGLDEKAEFVEQVHADDSFKTKTIEFLSLEKYLRQDIVERVPEVFAIPARRIPIRSLRRSAFAGAALAAATALLVFLLWPAPQKVPIFSEPYRFVIYRPDVSRAEVAGDFTGWSRVPMQRIGSSGYWEISLSLHPGEHRYVFILGGNDQIPDPTVMTREKDGFGGLNSVITTGDSA